jgi:hypothetical protein
MMKLFNTDIAIGALLILIVGLVIVVAGLTYTLENYTPQAKLTWPPLWQTAYGQTTTPTTPTSSAQQVIDTAKAECAGQVTSGIPEAPAEILPLLAEACISLVYESASTIVFTGDLLVSTGTGLYTDNQSPWKAVDGFEAQGYSIESISLAGQGSQGNPHKVYVVMSK